MNAYIGKLLGSLRHYRKWQVTCIVAAMAACMWLGARIGASQSRYTVTGKVDPTTGYRIIYSVSSRYHRSVDKDPIAQSKRELEAWAYDPSAKSSTARWIDEHIFGRAPAGSDHRNNGHSIRQATIRGISPPGTMVNTDGYVEMVGISKGIMPVFKQHLLISGCPSTWTGVDVPVGTYNGSKLLMHLFGLFIRPKNHPIIYGFVAMSGSDVDANEIQNEMNAIRASIRIEKMR